MGGPTPDAGFTLVELTIVTVIIATISAIATPMITSAKISSNESIAAATMRRIARAQKEMMAVGIDSNLNGDPEYGFLQELSGVRNVRVDTNDDGIADAEGTSKLPCSVLSSSYGRVNADGLLERSGYLFRLYLPADDLGWTPEPGPSQSFGNVSARNSARYWACYAWPASYGETGYRAFFVNQSGHILACANDPTCYDGIVDDPHQEAALAPGGSGKMDAAPAIDRVGTDGNTWRVIQ